MDPSLASQTATSPIPHAGKHGRVSHVATPARFNIYANPHKGLRLAFGEVLTAAGRVDPEDEQDVAGLVGLVRALLRFCRSHLEKEEAFVHPAIEARRAGASAATHDDHRDHLAAFEQLESEVHALETAGREHRDAAATQLYRHLALFVADNLVHMHVEETDNNAALWAAYDDAELHALEQRLVASIPPDMLQLGLRWMMPAMNPAERAGLLRGIRERAPAPAFAGMLAAVQASLTEAERQKLARALAQ
jgi:hypothetical protein